MAAALNPESWWQRLRWEWRRRSLESRFLPWLVLLLGLLALGSLVDGWQQKQIAAMPAVVQAVRARPGVIGPEQQARADLARFYRGLPSGRALAAPLATLLRLGDEHGVHFSEGEYHRVAEPDAPLLREDIILPVTASPGDILAYVHAAMQALPSLTVSGLSFEREDVNTVVVRARIHFVLVAGGAP